MKILTENVFESRTSYPWDEWMDGQVREATRGVDFTCTPAGFQAAVKNHARRHGKVVQTSRNGDKVTFRFSPRGEGGE